MNKEYKEYKEYIKFEEGKPELMKLYYDFAFPVEPDPWGNDRFILGGERPDGKVCQMTLTKKLNDMIRDTGAKKGDTISVEKVRVEGTGSNLDGILTWNVKKIN